MEDKNNSSVVISAVVIVILIVVGIYMYMTSTPEVSNPTQTSQNAQVTYPQGDETLVPGQSYTLTWNPPSVSGGNTQIFLIDTSLESEGASVSLTDRVYDIPDNGSYLYTIPRTAPAGSYRFEIGTLMSKPFLISSSTGPSSSTTSQ